MKAFTLEEISRAVGGVLDGGGATFKINSVSTDTRTLKSGDLFIALRGEHHDAHDYLDRAVDSGAAALMVDKDPGKLQVPVIKVENTLLALQDLALFNREHFDGPVVAVTGSSGKTTTKDMLASVLSTKYSVLKTGGNYNNEIGLPLTLLQLDDTCDTLVLEMAMRGAGEIDLLCRICWPTAGVITNIGEAHLEKLGSVENIARSKAELLDYVPPEGFAVLHGDSPYLAGEAYRCRGEVIYFGEKGNDIFAENIRREGSGNKFTIVNRGEKADLFVPLAGRHNIYNALAAAAAGKKLGLSYAEIERGLAGTVFSGMRWQVLHKGSYTIINDAYNANPDSTVAALQSLEEMAGAKRKVAVLGNMLELGALSREGHNRVGRAANYYGIQELVTLGELAEDIARGAEGAGMPRKNIHRCSSNAGAAAVLREILQPGDVVLVKGSRGMRMEEIVEAIDNNN